MAVSIRTQYDKQGYAQARIQGAWKAITQGGRGRRQTDEQRLQEIEGYGKKFAKASDSVLKDASARLREKLQVSGGDLFEVVSPAFALVREASRRTTGLYHYPEQILASLALVQGGIAEMATGEGKTLAITLPAYLFGITGRGVHVVTVNSYLAERDFEFTEPLFRMLGVSAAHLPEEQDRPAKREAYLKDITYGVGYEFGFDYLRDQLALMRQPSAGPRERLRDTLLGQETPAADVVQRPLAYAIVDEVDSVMIDEAGSPLLISESSDTSDGDKAVLELARQTALSLQEKVHFLIESGQRSVKLTQLGADVIHEIEDIPWVSLRRPWQNYVLNALRAEHFFFLDIQYVIDDEEKVVIVDEFTGRSHKERTWRDGLHQAVECKEGVEIRAENRDAASITRQRYFDRYETIAGLTGTAAESAGEFWHFFRLAVIQIPLHKPGIRKQLPERLFQTQDAMYKAVVADIIERKKRNQPVLVGTRTIRASEAISERLEETGIAHSLLTAKQDEEESEQVADAGKPGKVLIATNMAGRGTQIDLTPQTEAAGGLHVIAVERNESARIDRQLIGRAARQGQPGSAQLFVSADDHLIDYYDTALAEEIRKAPATPEGEVISSFTKAIDRLQQKVERIRYDQRLKMARRDEWLDQTKKTLA